MVYEDLGTPRGPPARMPGFFIQGRVPVISLQTNLNSLIAQQNLGVNNLSQSRTIQQLSSGYRINSSADDAAGLSIAN